MLVQGLEHCSGTFLFAVSFIMMVMMPWPPMIRVATRMVTSARMMSSKNKITEQIYVKHPTK
jgi:hypothetical protein